MTSALPITTLFLNIDGVLLTNGWDRGIRILASKKFGLDHAEMDERHHLTFDTYEGPSPVYRGGSRIGHSSQLRGYAESSSVTRAFVAAIMVWCS